MDLFGTAGIRGPVTEVTPGLALAVGQAVAARLDPSDGPVVIGRDGRETGAALAGAAEAGLTSGGLDVRRAGQLPTPALAFASRGRHGLMLTASHNPPEDNGIKLFADGTEYDRAAEREIERLVDSGPDQASHDQWGTSEEIEPLAAYRDSVTEYAQRVGAPLADLRIAVDCGTGMAGLATPQVLTTLGADVRALNANVDGQFPARESKPTAETLTDLSRFVADGPAAFGIGHDGDADRIVILDGDGEVVHEDTILAIVAEHYVDRSEAGDPVVVTTPNASGRIDERVAAAGGRVERVRLGALHEGIARVREAGTDETTVVFAAEPWKHIHPEFGEWIDAVVSAAVLSRLVAEEGLDSLRDPVAERPYRKVSVDCPDDRKAAVMERLHGRLPETFPEATVDTDYGVRLDLPDGEWTLVRPSGTEPYIRVYAESDDVDALVETVRGTVERAVTDAE
ncbi:phosphomannomutase [Halovenus sp. WSH3]|uniref:Phosphomannomutase n=1 Tax=Halovenus carboxidivorans TaxID=2692199 RepID=A0A6B0T7P7_9EURY|nr:phosphomannomutase [Halovenus carboxidivorans]MXR51623.1 phosphomannomutase [Halovenus carboxidivorans]